MTGSNPVGQGSSPWGRAFERTIACIIGLIVQQEDTSSAHWRSRCKSGWVHSTQSCGLAAKAALLQGADRGFESLQDYFQQRPDTPIGRATRLKPECLQVRPLLWVLKKTLGRGEPATTGRPLQTRNTWGARPTGRRLFCKQKIGVRFPGAPLISITAR